ncbi:MAG TPA: multicopper oxidase domain-containing protein [Steroidobacteraceae bacterium]|nr:multicopper oxidase domain-containing protein [Steroidobacteraceae bacterium]
MWSRRRALKGMLAAGAALGVRSPVRSATAGQEPDLELRLVAAPGRAQILPGAQTAVLRYNGQVLRGRRDALRPAGYLVARFAVSREGAARGEALRLPPEDLALPEPRLELQTRLAFRMMRGFLNGRHFQMDAVASDERLPFDEPVRWTFENTDAGGMMAMPHPMHVHSARFPILERAGPVPPDLAEGLVNAGYKDTVLVIPGERVRVQFAPLHRGLFLYHCHNLEHEDGGMMRNYLVS